MKKNSIVKEAGVLLIGVLLLCTSVTSLATTINTGSLTPSPSKINTLTQTYGPCSEKSNVFLWDNYVAYWRTAYHSQDDPPEEPEQWDSFVADDFMFEEESEVLWIFWEIVYWNCNNAEGPKDYHYDWNVTFFEDDGSGYHPGDIYAGPFTIADEDMYKSIELENTTSLASGYWACGISAFLPEPITFAPDTKYWISLYSIGPIFPQSGWPVHNTSVGGIRLHEGNFKSDHFGYPDWTNFTLVDGEALDANFVLGHDLPFEITLEKGLGVTATITNLMPEGYDSLNATITFTATGGFVFPRTKSIFVGDIVAGETTDPIKWYPLGIGSITIEAFVIDDGAAVGLADTTGFLFLLFLL